MVKRLDWEKARIRDLIQKPEPEPDPWLSQGEEERQNEIRWSSITRPPQPESFVEGVKRRAVEKWQRMREARRDEAEKARKEERKAKKEAEKARKDAKKARTRK